MKCANETDPVAVEVVGRGSYGLADHVTARSPRQRASAPGKQVMFAKSKQRNKRDKDVAALKFVNKALKKVRADVRAATPAGADSAEGTVDSEPPAEGNGEGVVDDDAKQDEVLCAPLCSCLFIKLCSAAGTKCCQAEVVDIIQAGGLSIEEVGAVLAAAALDDDSNVTSDQEDPSSMMEGHDDIIHVPLSDDDTPDSTGSHGDDEHEAGFEAATNGDPLKQTGHVETRMQTVTHACKAGCTISVLREVDVDTGCAEGEADSDGCASLKSHSLLLEFGCTEHTCKALDRLPASPLLLNLFGTAVRVSTVECLTTALVSLSILSGHPAACRSRLAPRL